MSSEAVRKLGMARLSAILKSIVLGRPTRIDDNFRKCDEIMETTESRHLSAEEQYFYEQSYKDPVESIARIEDVAKFLVGATATTSGLFLSAFKLVLGTSSAQGIFWLLPFVAWAVSIVVLVFVLFPQRYPVGHSQPASWKTGFIRARRNKYTFLAVGTLFFVLGILLAILPLAV